MEVPLDGNSAGELFPELVLQGRQAQIEAEASAALGAARHERTAQRRGHHNDSRDRLLATRAVDLQHAHSSLQGGKLLPPVPEPCHRVDRALWDFVMETCVSGVSTRKVDELVAALGCESGSSHSEVSRICQTLNTQVQSCAYTPWYGSSSRVRSAPSAAGCAGTVISTPSVCRAQRVEGEAEQIVGHLPLEPA